MEHFHVTSSYIIVQFTNNNESLNESNNNDFKLARINTINIKTVKETNNKGYCPKSQLY